MLCVAKKYPRLSESIFNGITTDTQIKSILKIVPPNISVSSQTSHNQITNDNDSCGTVLQKLFLLCFLLPKFAWHQGSADFDEVIASEAPGYSIHGFYL